MKKANCRISMAVKTWKDAEEQTKRGIQAFLDLSDEEFDKVYERLELDIHIEKISAEHMEYFADATFRIPNFE